MSISFIIIGIILFLIVTKSVIIKCNISNLLIVISLVLYEVSFVNCYVIVGEVSVNICCFLSLSILYIITSNSRILMQSILFAFVLSLLFYLSNSSFDFYFLDKLKVIFLVIAILYSFLFRNFVISFNCLILNISSLVYVLCHFERYNYSFSIFNFSIIFDCLIIFILLKLIVVGLKGCIFYEKFKTNFVNCHFDLNTFFAY